MRIIAGDFKGRKLLAPKDGRIRPTTDRVKESIFSMIAPYLEDAVVIDLFSGTGNLGLEALSRGASRCWFGDKSRESMDLTRRNIALCKQEDRARTVLGDYKHVLENITEKADLIFLDPPYEQDLIQECFRLITELDLMNDGGIIVVEHSADKPLEDRLFGYAKIKERTYGTITVNIYSKDLEETFQ